MGNKQAIQREKEILMFELSQIVIEVEGVPGREISPRLWPADWKKMVKLMAGYIQNYEQYYELHAQDIKNLLERLRQGRCTLAEVEWIDLPAAASDDEEQPVVPAQGVMVIEYV